LSGSAGGKLGLDQDGLEAKIDMNATLASAKLGPVEAKVGIGGWFAFFSFFQVNFFFSRNRSESWPGWCWFEIGGHWLWDWIQRHRIIGVWQ
jgi:hypothetical protein